MTAKASVSTAQASPETPPVTLTANEHSVVQPARFAALQSHNFKLLWFGLLISNAGTWMEATATSWLITDLARHNDSFWLGVNAAAFAVPMLILPPFGGVVADRFNRIRALLGVQIIYLIASSTLAILVLTDVIRIWMIIVYALFNGIVLAFDSPVRHSLVPDIVEREQVASAVSLNSVAFTGASLVGPAIAGALIPLIGVGGVMSINA